MKRPWQIWLLFLLCLGVTLPAMGWLTLKALELDRTEAAARRLAEEKRHEAEVERRRAEIERNRAESERGRAELARQRAELEEDINLALWRLDTWLTPLIAQEAARPYFVYRPFYKAPAGKGSGKDALRDVPSPLAEQPSDFILLHFQLDESDALTSPQYPTGLFCEVALSNGVRQDNIDTSGQRLKELRPQIKFEALCTRLPVEMLPPVEVAEVPWAVGNYYANPPNSAPIQALNVLGLPILDRQVAEMNRQQKFNLSQAQINNDFQVDGNTSGPQPPVGRQIRGQAANPPAQQQAAAANEPAGGPQPQAGQQSPQVRGRRGNDFSQGARSGQGQQQEPRPSQQAAANPPPQTAGPPLQANSRYERGRGPGDNLMRGGVEWARRNRSVQSYAQRVFLEQRVNNDKLFSSPMLLTEGVTRPLWIDNNLVLARRVTANNQVLVQGCWLDWPKLKAELIAEVADLLPEADLLPVGEDSEVNSARMLATLPVRLVVPDPVSYANALMSAAVDPPAIAPLVALAEAPLSPIRMSLWFAWGCLLLATVAIALLLSGVMTLSERRGAFVAAVTHELRTPLTTFRMYAEMLAEGMLSDEKQQQSYLETLRVESERLTHLVENVLSYARLERGRGGRREDVALGPLIDRMEQRLKDRATQAQMELIVEADDASRATTVSTDPAAVEQVLFNLVDNACKYAVAADDRRIHLSLDATAARASIRVQDHGPGISPKAAKLLFRPFSKSVHDAANTAPGVGLGLALSRRLARDIGGSLAIEKSNGHGASFVLTLTPVRR